MTLLTSTGLDFGTSSKVRFTNPEKSNGYSKSYLAKQTKNECVYCEKPDHRSCDCKTAKTVTEHRKVLSDKKHCFNCTGAKHRAAECRSAKTCLKCKLNTTHLYVIN